MGRPGGGGAGMGLKRMSLRGYPAPTRAFGRSASSTVVMANFSSMRQPRRSLLILVLQVAMADHVTLAFETTCRKFNPRSICTRMRRARTQSGTCLPSALMLRQPVC